MRAPHGPIVPLVLVAIVALATTAGPPGPARSYSGRPAASVGWPPSSGLVISEVQTGGTSASDEFIELANAGTVMADLAGLEVVGVSSSGVTVARRVVWTEPTIVEPGRHVLVANVAGVWASIADATYVTGIAASGGAVAIRPVGGTPIDAVGWGDAANAYVEGVAAPAPPAGSSIERRPGGSLGNGADANDNAADWVVRAGACAAAPRRPARAGTVSERESRADAGAIERARRVSDAGADGHTDVHCHTDSNAHAHARPDAGADPPALAHSRARPHAHADAHADSGPDAGSHAHADSGPDAGSHA